jgi:hypothetical protein
MKRKTLILPSGATTTVRPLSPLDFAGAGLIRPNTTKVPEVKDTEIIEPEQQSTEMQEWNGKVSRLAILKACGHFRAKDGRNYVIVDKPFHLCNKLKTHTEVCPEDLPQADVLAIIAAVNEISGMEQEAAEAAQTFPAEPATSDNGPSPG